MLINIEQEYNDFIGDLWRSLSNSTKDILESHQQPKYIYNFISLRLTLFIHLELKNLETKNKPAKS